MIKVAFSLLILIHAAIHLMGFVKAMHPSALPEIHLTVSKSGGIVWLVAALVMGAVAVTRLLDVRIWWAIALPALVLSQTAIVGHWGDAKFGTVPNLIVLVAGLLAYGGWRFEQRTVALVEQLDAASEVAAEGSQSTLLQSPRSREASQLPTPVRRYLEKVLLPGARLSKRVVVEQVGSFNTGGSNPAWKPFVATHIASTRPPAFVWSADIRFAPGVSVFVHDSFLAHRGAVEPYIVGLIPLDAASDTGGEVARGELLRFLAEAPWYPNVLRDHQALSWKAIDNASAEATLTEGSITVSLTFHFNEAGYIESVRTENRSRLVQGSLVPTPWIGHWSDYQERDGIVIPLQGEVAWVLEGAERPYWRGKVTRLLRDGQ